MTRTLGLEGSPRAHLRVPAHWPYGETEHPSARYAQAFAARLQQVLGHRSLRWLARTSGISHGTISMILRGLAWPDLATVSALEWALGTSLWPGPELFTEELRDLRSERARYWRSVSRRERPGER